MGVPLHTDTFCSLLAVEDFIDRNPDQMNVKITVTGVHVRDIPDLVKLLSRKEYESGWEVINLDSISAEGRQFHLFVDEFESMVDEAIRSIDDDGAVTASLGESLKEEADRFLEVVKDNNIFSFFLGFAQFTVHVGDNAIAAAAAAAIMDGEEETDTDEEGGADGEVDEEEDDDEVADEAGAVEEAVQVQDQAGRLSRLREDLVQVKTALKRLTATCLVFEPSKQNPEQQYSELMDFAHIFPVDPEPELVPPPALPAEAIPAQPDANAAEAAPQE